MPCVKRVLGKNHADTSTFEHTEYVRTYVRKRLLPD